MTTDKERFEEIRKRRQASIAAHETEVSTKSKLEREIKDTEKQTEDIRDQIRILEREFGYLEDERKRQSEELDRLTRLVEDNTDISNVELMLSTVVDMLCKKYRRHGMRMKIEEEVLLRTAQQIMDTSQISLKGGRATLNINIGAIPIVPDDS
jgi:chromosome segregation ATPase